MSANEATALGSLDRETKNAVRYSTTWGVIYIPKTELAKIGNPEQIKVTVQAVEV